MLDNKVTFFGFAPSYCVLCNNEMELIDIEEIVADDESYTKKSYKCCQCGNETESYFEYVCGNVPARSS